MEYECWTLQYSYCVDQRHEEWNFSIPPKTKLRSEIVGQWPERLGSRKRKKSGLLCTEGKFRILITFNPSN